MCSWRKPKFYFSAAIDVLVSYRSRPNYYSKPPQPNSVATFSKDDSGNSPPNRVASGTMRKGQIGGDSKSSVASTSVGMSAKKGGYRRLTDAEFQSKVDKALCFRCDKKYAPGHRCKYRQLQVLIVSEDEEDEEGEEEEAKVEEVETEEKLLELSINSLAGENSPKTLKLRGKLQGKDIVILLDCGATHNFISKGLV